jgi:RNA polymerase primary sigma factor
VDQSTIAGESAYFQEIARYPLLSAAEEVELAQRIEAGRDASEQLASGDLSWTVDLSQLQHLTAAGVRARNQMIECNLRLVVSVARRRAGRGVSLLDLLQEGSIGLQTAVEKFEWQRGLRFSTYAYWWIQQSMTRAIQNHGRIIRLPAHVIADVTKVNRGRAALHQELGREPRVVDLADRLNMSPMQVRELISVSNATVSLAGC